MGGIPGNYVQPRGEHGLDWNYLLLGCLQANVEEFNQRCLCASSFHVVHLFSSTVHFPRLQRLLNQPICLMYKCTQHFYFFIWCLRKHLYEGSQLNMSLLYIYTHIVLPGIQKEKINKDTKQLILYLYTGFSYVGISMLQVQNTTILCQNSYNTS